MKKSAAACTLICLIAATAFATNMALPNYAGTWVLNKEKSTLPARMANIDKMELVVTQTDKVLTVKSSAGGGQEIAYNLDGTKGKAQMGGRMPGEATVSLEKKDDGKILLHSEREITFQENVFTIKSTETWELLDAGKTLKVKRDTESPRGTESAEMVFTLKT